MECRVAATFDWEWGPSTLQRLGKAQALRVYIYIYISTSTYYVLHKNGPSECWLVCNPMNYSIYYVIFLYMFTINPRGIRKQGPNVHLGFLEVHGSHHDSALAYHSYILMDPYRRMGHIYIYMIYIANVTPYKMLRRQNVFSLKHKSLRGLTTYLTISQPSSSYVLNIK